MFTPLQDFLEVNPPKNYVVPNVRLSFTTTLAIRRDQFSVREGVIREVCGRDSDDEAYQRPTITSNQTKFSHNPRFLIPQGREKSTFSCFSVMLHGTMTGTLSRTPSNEPTREGLVGFAS